MGDWCGRDITTTDTATQRNYGKGTEALNQSVGNATSSLCEEKNKFSLPRRSFSLDTGPFNG
jgi:hypothetical protein